MVDHQKPTKTNRLDLQRDRLKYRHDLADKRRIDRVNRPHPIRDWLGGFLSTTTNTAYWLFVPFAWLWSLLSFVWKWGQVLLVVVAVIIVVRMLRR